MTTNALQAVLDKAAQQPAPEKPAVRRRADEPLAFAHRPEVSGRLGVLSGFLRQLGARLRGRPLSDRRCGRRVRALAGGRLLGGGLLNGPIEHGLQCVRRHGPHSLVHARIGSYTHTRIVP